MQSSSKNNFIKDSPCTFFFDILPPTAPLINVQWTLPQKLSVHIGPNAKWRIVSTKEFILWEHGEYFQNKVLQIIN